MPYVRPRTNPGRIAAIVIAWVSVVLVPAAGVVAMAIDQQAGWVLFIYIVGLGPLQAVAHVALAVMLGVARSAAPGRSVSPWMPMAYMTYLLTFLASSFLILDAGDTPEYYSPWRESASAAVLPLFIVSVAAFLAMFGLVILDLLNSKRAQATACSHPSNRSETNDAYH